MRFVCVDLTSDGLYTFFLDNEQVAQHTAIVIGLRELNSIEAFRLCQTPSNDFPSVSKEAFHFSSDYFLRSYLSGCYYLDANHQWQSDGLLVGVSIVSSSMQLRRFRSVQRRMFLTHNVFLIVSEITSSTRSLRLSEPDIQRVSNLIVDNFLVVVL